MKPLYIFLSIFLLFGCATKRKTKEVSKLEIESANVAKNDSLFQLEIKSVKDEKTQQLNEFENILKTLNVQYDGEQDNQLKIIYKRTRDGIELNLSGKGKANYTDHLEQTKTFSANNVSTILDSVFNKSILQYKVSKEKHSSNNITSNTNKNKFDFSFWIYAIIAFVIFIFLKVKYFKK